MGRVVRRLAGVFAGLGVVVTFGAKNPWLGVPLFVVGVIMAVWFWRFD
jgi:hypothetical protein